MNNSKIVSLLSVILATMLFANGTFADSDSCETPDEQLGECIDIVKCRYLFDKLVQKPRSQESTIFLQKSQCGQEGKHPKVCCDYSRQNEASSGTSHRNFYLLNHAACGFEAAKPDVSGAKLGGVVNVPKFIIAGGLDATLNEFAWMALLAYDIGYGNIAFECGGTVINDRYVLTAAHCVSNLPAKKRLIGVRVGEHNLRTEKDCSEAKCNFHYQDLAVERAIGHAQFDANLSNDIALIRLKGTLDLVSTSRPICLPFGSAATIPEQLTVIGWGFYDSSKKMSQVLQKATLPLYSHEDCADAYEKYGKRIGQKQICAGGQRGVDTCQGDSGGPLFHIEADRMVQYGIVSFSLNQCGAIAIPGVYTRLDKYLHWILDNIAP